METETSLASVEDFLVPADEAQDEQAQGDAAEPVADDAGEPEAPEDQEAAEDEPEEDEQDEEDAAPPPVDAPHSWSKEDKEVFAKLDPAAQAVVLRRETERDNFVKQKAWEASQARQQVETQARDVIAAMHTEHAQRLEAYARMMTPQQPDQRLLYSGDQNLVNQYHQQRAAYDAAVDQQRELHQQIAQAQAAAESAREQSQQAEIASDAQRLREQLPEWFDPSAGPKLQQELQSIGAELGYPAELMAQAGSTDIIALKKAAEWKAKAAKFDALMSKKMETVRAAKGVPQMSRPGASQGKGQRAMTAQSDRDLAIQQFQQTRSADAAAALLLTRNR